MSAVAFAKCRCCGVEVTGRQRCVIQRCPVCDMCDGVHGRARHEQVSRMVALGRLHVWSAIAMVAFDDAWLAGKLQIQPDGSVLVPVAVKRWEVLIGWYRIAGLEPSMERVVEAVLTRYEGLEPSDEVLAQAKAECAEAMRAVNPNIVVMFGELPEGDAPPTMVFDDKSVQLPADLFARPKGSA